MSIINFKYRLLLIFLSICFVHLAQNKESFGLENIDFKYNEEAEAIEITYDIKNFKPQETYKISLDLSGYNSNKPIESISGDYNMLRGDGGTKTMLWSQKKDGYTFDDEIAFGLSISLDSKVHIPYKSHVWKSIIIPGLGDYRIRNKKHYIVYGIIFYGSIYASYSLNQQMQENYSAYNSSFEINQSNELFKKAKNQQLLSRALSATAVVMWTFDILTLKNHIKNNVKKNLNQGKSEYYYNRSIRDEEFVSYPKYINTKELYEQEFDLAMEEYENKNWHAALKYFEKSKSLKPSKEILDKIKEFIPITKNEIAYLQAIEMADNYFENEQYKKALSKYKKAKSLKANEDYPKRRIELTNKKITLNTNYDKAISAGDNYLMAKNYDKAKEEYKKAKNIKPKENYPNIKINEIDNIIVDNNYNKKIKDGDNYLMAKNYDKAREEYKKAKNIKPKENYPNIKINEIDNIILDNKFDKAIADGNKYFNRRDYQKAREQYKKAQNIKQFSSEAKAKIEEVDYKIAILNGNTYFNNGKYYEAKSEYRNAQNIKPNSNEAKRKINEAEYEIAIADGDRYFRTGKYEAAIIEYESANKIMPQKRYPKDQIIKCKDANKKGISIYDDQYIEIYNENNLKVEIKVSFGEGCNMMKANMYSYRYDGTLSSETKYINWKIDYIDCNNQKYTFARGIPIGGKNIKDEIGDYPEDIVTEGFDDNFTSKKLIKEVYDIGVSYQEKRRDK